MTIKLFCDETNTKKPITLAPHFDLPSLIKDPTHDKWYEAIDKIKELEKKGEEFCCAFLEDIHDAESFLAQFPNKQVDLIYVSDGLENPFSWSNEWKSWIIHNTRAETFTYIDSNGIGSVLS